MSVESVNNNSNAGLYATGAALVGGGAGVATGYLTRPFLKDGAPTDSFVKKMNENLKEIITPEAKEIAEEIDNKFSNFKESVNNAKTIDELKDVYIKNTFGEIPEESLSQLKQSTDLQEQIFKTLQLDKTICDKFLDNIRNANSVEDLKTSMLHLFDEEHAGKSLEEIKNIELDSLKTMEKTVIKTTFEMFWDNSKKAFVNCEEGAGKAIKKAAKSIQGKYAAIYGAIGAGVLGLGTYLCCHGKKQVPQPQESVDTQA